MRKMLPALALAAGALPTPAEARPDAVETYATSYCLRGKMADGSYVRPGSAASNRHELGTRIRLLGRAFFGRRRFVIRDTGRALGDGHVDLWAPSCSTAKAWGHRAVRYVVTYRP